MRVLVLSQYFWPESFIINDIVRTLDEQGHEVVVATGKPNYPDGKVFEGYRAFGTQRERYLDRIDVVRVPLWPRGGGGARNLILNYLSFVIAGFFCLPWLLRKREFDAILVFAPSPILQAIPAIPLKWIKRAKLALWVQDLWPDSLAATGFVKNPHVLRIVGWLVKAIYRCCDKLLVQSPAFFMPVARYAPKEKIYYFPNSIRGERIAEESTAVPRELIELLNNHFCVVFAGNLGTAQGLETIVQAAIELRGEPDLRVVLVGSGSRLAWLESQKRSLGLDNLVLPGRFPIQAMPYIFERSSALLVTLSDRDIFSQTVPSKIQAYLAAGKPILASLNGEGARVVIEAGAGLTSPAEQVHALVKNIREFQSMSPLQRKQMGRAGRDYFDRNFEMRSQVKRLVEMLQ
ncbi:glycosyltransferase family 4 protein [Pseudomonas peli]|uniref:glycosyltransferase family 4 protein n=1 Tax=Pseudomonas peli TaxID=592361 RepID=UPI00285F6BD0|nr:glycosyltransferase family 4 protein [Pseudomonas peli]MDR7022775.1 glycosyltransferase involved in cell wall biosynthesis [Pseudomonas peli]